MVEYTTFYKEGNIQFLIQLAPGPTVVPLFSHKPKSIYVTFATEWRFDWTEVLIAITVYENHKDLYTIHPSHTPYDSTPCHEHTSLESGHNKIEYKDMPKEHIDLFNNVVKIIKEHPDFEKLIENKYETSKRCYFLNNDAKLQYLNKYFFNSDIHWTYAWGDFNDHKHVIEWDDKKQAYLYWWDHSDGIMKYFKTLTEVFSYVGSSLYDEEYNNWLDALEKADFADFWYIQ